MAAIEKLLTMGLAHGIDPTRMLLAAGGTPGPESERLTWQDVTLAVVALPLPQRAALYLKCAPELASAQELASLTNMLLELLMLHDEKRATYPTTEPGFEAAAEHAKFQRQATIVRVALEEYCDPRTCRRCHGEGQVLDHVVGRGMVRGTCGRCEGKGWRAWSDNHRARSCGVRRGDWTARYAHGYQRVLETCTSIYREAAGGFKAALFGAPHLLVENRLQVGA